MSHIFALGDFECVPNGIHNFNFAHANFSIIIVFFLFCWWWFCHEFGISYSLRGALIRCGCSECVRFLAQISTTIKWYRFHNVLFPVHKIIHRRCSRLWSTSSPTSFVISAISSNTKIAFVITHLTLVHDTSNESIHRRRHNAFCNFTFCWLPHFIYAILDSQNYCIIFYFLFVAMLLILSRLDDKFSNKSDKIHPISKGMEIIQLSCHFNAFEKLLNCEIISNVGVSVCLCVLHY